MDCLSPCSCNRKALAHRSELRSNQKTSSCVAHNHSTKLYLDRAEQASNNKCSQRSQILSTGFSSHHRCFCSSRSSSCDQTCSGIMCVSARVTQPRALTRLDARDRFWELSDPSACPRPNLGIFHPSNFDSSTRSEPIQHFDTSAPSGSILNFDSFHQHWLHVWCNRSYRQRRPHTTLLPTTASGTGSSFTSCAVGVRHTARR